MTVTNAAAALFLAGTTLTLVFAETACLADVASFFRPHLFVVGMVIFAFCLTARSYFSLVPGGAAVAMAALPLVTAPSAAAPRHGNEVRFMTANLFIQNTEFGRLQQFIGEVQPDFVLTQETPRLWQDVLNKHSEFPYQSARNMKSRNDMKLFSRYPFLSERVVDGGKNIRLSCVIPSASKWRSRMEH